MLTEREILRNLQAIVADADQLPVHEVAKNSIGVLSTENRKVWSSLRQALTRNRNNESCLDVIDNALFVVCLDDAQPDNLAELCNNFLCGTYDLKGGVQVGTCTNRWYDKVSVFGDCVIFVRLTRMYFHSCKSSLLPTALLVSTLSTLALTDTPC